MKKLLPLLLCLFLFNSLSSWAQPTGLTYNTANYLCDLNQSWTLDTSPTAVAPTGSGENYGCLSGSSLNRPHWFRFYVSTGGNINMQVLPVLNTNLDHVVWGPFTDPFPPTIQSLGAPIHCSNSPILVDNIVINNQPSGAYYVIMVANQQGLNNSFRFVPNPGHTAVFGTSLSITLPNLVTVRSCDAAFPITYVPSVGVADLTFSGAGVNSSGTFNPSVAGVGTHIITVSGRPFNCPSVRTATCTVQVLPSPSTVSIDAIPGNGISYSTQSTTRILRGCSDIF